MQIPENTKKHSAWK